MIGCAKLVDKLSTSYVQAGCLYALCTRPWSVGRFFVRRPSTGMQVLDTAYGRRFLQNPSVKLSCAHYAQDLLIQLNYRKLLGLV